MGSWSGFLLCVWLLQNSVADAFVPLLANSDVITINPTYTTVVLEKPYCLQDSENVYLFVVEAGVATKDVLDAAKKPLTRSYRETNGGKTSPYLAAIFKYPGCSTFPDFTKIKDSNVVQGILDSYIVRVGADFACLDDPNFSGTCNAPLRNSTAYSFKYVFTDSTNVSKGETDWSARITTNTARDASSIDTWPGRRSGGMIVLTSILSVLVFFIVLGLVAAIASGLLSSPSPGIEATRHESRSTHMPSMKPQSTSEPMYSSTLPAEERPQYVAHPQA